MLLELRAPPFQRGLETVAASDLLERIADLGGRRIERRADVEAGLDGVAETGSLARRG